MTSAAVSRPPEQGWLTGWLHGWLHVVFLVLNLVTGVVAVTIALCVLVGAVSLVALGAGALVLVPALWAGWLFAREELLRLEVLTGVRIPPPPPGQEPTWVTVVGLSREHRRAAAYTALHSLWGLVSGAVVASLLAAAVALLAMPLYADRIPDSGLEVLWLVHLTSPASRVVAWVLVLLALVAAPFLARGVTGVDRMMARWLLGADPEQQIADLSERVETLTQTRTETVDSVEHERRRIERDLHDGPQQRLVAIAMDLGLARERLAEDPDGAKELLDKAHAASKEAIVEMRHVARGITPPILADRGLDAAVTALAARSPVPVAVEIRDVGRLDPTTEAVAYFCVSELLTNVAKHSHARRATVRLALQGDDPGSRLVLEVEDDGVGGADPARGSGLVGLRQRLAGLDGTLQVVSPGGGPTLVTVVLPAPATRTPSRRTP